MAVTDQSGRVHRVSNLRVVDCSIMRRVPSADINVHSIMVAERIASEVVAAQIKNNTKVAFA